MRVKVDESESDVSISGSCGHSNSSSSDSGSPQAVSPVTPPKTITQTLDLSQAASNGMSVTLSSWTSFHNRPLMPRTTFQSPQVPLGGIGRLDLLALAVEHAA